MTKRRSLRAGAYAARIRRRTSAALAAALLAAGSPVIAQDTPWTAVKPGSDNIEVLGHLPLGPRLSVADMDVEQELDRPFAYVARMVYGTDGPKGTDIISRPGASRAAVRMEDRGPGPPPAYGRHGREALQVGRPLLRGAVPPVRPGRSGHGPGRRGPRCDGPARRR